LKNVSLIFAKLIKLGHGECEKQWGAFFSVLEFTGTEKPEVSLQFAAL
jgi:hypothetical protein